MDERASLAEKEFRLGHFVAVRAAVVVLGHGMLGDCRRYFGFAAPMIGACGRLDWIVVSAVVARCGVSGAREFASWFTSISKKKVGVVP